jgi:hypothetical protein
MRNKTMDIEKEICQIKEELKNHQERISKLESLLKRARKKVPLLEPSGQNLIMDIVNKIKNCEESDKIETQVLDKNEQEGRILLPYYISYKYFSNRPLTSGDIEKITGELGVKIKAPNAAKEIKKSLLRYLSSDFPRKKGRPTPYKLNRKGAKRFKEILNFKDIAEKA